MKADCRSFNGLCPLALGLSRRAALTAIAQAIGTAQAVGRAFRVELQHPDAATAVSDESVRAVAVDLHGALRTPIHIARRSVPAPRWAENRPMGWGPDGLALGESAPALPFGGSESVGVAIEVGDPTVIAKARIVGGIDAAHLRLIAAGAGAVASTAPSPKKTKAVVVIESMFGARGVTRE